MAYAQIRVRRLNNSNLASTEKHNARLFSPEEYPDNIDMSKTIQNRMLYCRSDWEDEQLGMQEMVERRLKELKVKGIKSNSTKAIEVVVSVSDPDFFYSQGGYTPLGYGANEMKWLEDNYFGHGNVVCGYMHMEESKPHWHFICVPVREKEVAYKNRYGSGKRLEMRLCANDIIDGKEKLSALQDAYYEHCNSRYNHIVPFWRGLKAEKQKKEYTLKTDAKLAAYKEAEQYAEMKQLAQEAQQKVEQFDQTIEKQNKLRQSSSYQWDKNAEVPEWSWGKRGR
jgi:hypothetical protein